MSDTFVCQHCGQTRKLVNAVNRPCQIRKGRNVVSGFRLICGPCDAYATRVRLQCERRVKREAGLTRQAHQITAHGERVFLAWVHQQDESGAPQ